MNCLNCEKYLQDAIDSVFAQTYKDWEIIFWDNASTDSSAKIAQSYDEKLHYFKSDKTVSLYAARNLAMDHARGELIAFLDCDDLWMKDKLEKQIPLFEDKEVGLVFSDAIYFLNNGESFQLYKRRGYSTGHCFKELLRSYFLCLQSVVVRKSVIGEGPNYFDPRFNHVGDAELFLRVAFKWKLAMVDEPLVKWRIHEDSLTSKKGERFKVETEKMIENFRTIIPDFDVKYEPEVNQLMLDCILNHAKSLWNSGDSSSVRKELRPYIKNFKALTLYFFSFFPKKYFDRLSHFYKFNLFTKGNNP